MTATAIAVRERPILFSAAMVRAILDGRKTQSRRVLKLPRWFIDRDGSLDRAWPNGPMLAIPLDDDSVAHICSPYGSDGDSAVGEPASRLWVRETWTAEFNWPDDNGRYVRSWDEQPPAFRGLKSLDRLYFAADHAIYGLNGYGELTDGPVSDFDSLPATLRWRPSIFMPRWASRLALEITKVRVERLQAITPEDCEAEGIHDLATFSYDARRLKYGQLWDSLNARRGYSWNSNPWVWCLEFARVTP
jgi:hypothetical protein